MTGFSTKEPKSDDRNFHSPAKQMWHVPHRCVKARIYGLFESIVARATFPRNYFDPQPGDPIFTVVFPPGTSAPRIME